MIMKLKFLWLTLWAWGTLGLYLLIASLPARELSVVLMPPWVPFWPAWTPAYLLLLGAAWLLPMGITEEWRLKQCLIATSIAYACCMAWWIIHPTTMPRPPVDTVWHTLPYRRLIAIDPPRNILPAAHAIGPMVAAWFLTKEKPALGGWLMGSLVLAIPSIFLIHQHRPIDVLIGIAFAFIGILLATKMNDGVRPK
jgi:hypothetical protein